VPLSQGSLAEPNFGDYVNLDNPWVVGFDGISPHCTYVLDELVVYRRVRRNQEVRVFAVLLSGLPRFVSGVRLDDAVTCAI
jgi:hypothetical protein